MSKLAAPPQTATTTTARPELRRLAATRAWLWHRRYAVVYLAVAFWLVRRVNAAHDVHTGYTSLISFGEPFRAQRLQSLRPVPIYTYAYSDGYDGQFYAQLAVAGNPFDPELHTALDSAPYRTHRILLPLLAHVLGGGQPGAVLNVYALSNLACWLLLAWLLARWWFPPTDLQSTVRWTSVLLGVGVIDSVSRSLTDVPALLVVAIGARLIEQGRGRLGAVALAAAGLVRETSILAAAAFAPEAWRDRRAWVRGALLAFACVAPTVAWAVVLRVHYGPTTGGPIEPPLFAFARKLQNVVSWWRTHGYSAPVRDEVLAIVALVTQVGFIVARPRPRQVWWRIGAAFTLLWLCLGWPVWEGTPNAASRAVLPLTLAFNVLVPRATSWLPLLLAGNLSILSAPSLVNVRPSEQSAFTDNVTVSHGPGWFDSEYHERLTWRWAAGPAQLRFHNPNPHDFLATLHFELSSVTPRTVELHAAELTRTLALPTDERMPFTFGPFRLPPGDSTVWLDTKQPPWREGGGSGRPLAFALYDLYPTLLDSPCPPAP